MLLRFPSPTGKAISRDEPAAIVRDAFGEMIEKLPPVEF